MTVATRGVDRVRQVARGRRWVLATAAAAALAAPAAGQAAMVYQRAPGSLKAMYIANDDGTGARRLPGSGTSPVISPDGTGVAYQEFTRSGDGRLRILSVSSRTVVASPQVCRSAPVWSPDSSRLICTTETANRRGDVTGDGLALIDATTGVRRTLVAAPGNEVEGPTWSPDGTRIAYSNGRFGLLRSDVFVADPGDMGGATRVVRNATTPVWGPARIAVTRYTSRHVRVGGHRMQVVHSQIWTVNPSGGGAHVLTRYRTRRALVYGPSAAFWTPDGGRLVGEIGGTDFSQLIAVDARTGRIRALRPAGERVTYPNAISADGRVVLFTDGRVDGASSLRTVGIAGARGRVLLRGVSTVSASAGWQP